MMARQGFVLHLDIDSFFAQAEQLRDPSLQGKAIAVQQHQDIIAANHAAKAAGVTKHMAPAQARRLLAAVGGRVVHVYLAEGGRVSYKPYRELSARMLRVLRALPWAAVVEKASIDEAYILVQSGPGTVREGTAAPAGFAGASIGKDEDWGHEEEHDEEGEAAEGGGGGSWRDESPQVALRFAQEAKAAVLRELGLQVSVGAAPNRLIAKLASAAAKPDGVRLIADQQAALQLLSQTPARRLPGYGGRAADVFEHNDIRWATDLQRYSQPQLEQLLSLKPAAAAQLVQWCRGLDATPVQDRGPPKTLSVQMSLTPQLLAMHPSQGMSVSVAGGRAGVLEPLVVGRADFKGRVRQLTTAMGLDLLQRVQEDRAEEGRWPRTLAASLRAFGAGRDLSFTARSAAFPAMGLAEQPQQQEQQRQQEQQLGGIRQQQQAHAKDGGCKQQQQEQQKQQKQQQQQQGAGVASAIDSVAGGGERAAGNGLEEAVVAGLEQLIHQAASTYPPTATVVELRLAATNFESAAAAAAAAPISRFFKAVPRAQQAGQQAAGDQTRKGKQQVQQVQQQHEQQQAGHLDAEGQHVQQQLTRQAQQAQQAQQHHAHPQQAQADQQHGQPSQVWQQSAEDARQRTEACPQQLQPGSTTQPCPAGASNADPAHAGGSTADPNNGAGRGCVELSSIDVREQQRILQEIERRRRQQQQQQLKAQHAQRQAAQQPQADGVGKRRATGAAGASDSKQPKISAFLKR